MTERINPVCDACGNFMLAGVQPVEPEWFCPSHPGEAPVEVVDCEHCHGRGWKVAALTGFWAWNARHADGRRR
jgi:hypothetical protein